MSLNKGMKTDNSIENARNLTRVLSLKPELAKKAKKICSS